MPGPTEYLLDESALDISLPAGCTWLAFVNKAHATIDSRELRDRLRSAPGIEAIRKVRVDWTSHLTDLTVLEAMPRVEAVLVHGSQIATLAGIAAVSGGKILDVNTGPNKKRRLDALAGSRFESVQVSVA